MKENEKISKELYRLAHELLKGNPKTESMKCSRCGFSDKMNPSTAKRFGNNQRGYICDRCLSHIKKIKQEGNYAPDEAKGTSLRKVDYDKLKKFMVEFRDSECARIFNISRERVRQLRERFKIEMPKDRPVCKLSTYSEELTLKIIAMINEGCGLWEIAEKTGKSEATLYAYIRKIGFDFKDLNLKKKSVPYADRYQSKPKELKKAQEMYKKGHSLYRIYKELDISSALPYIWKKKGYFENLT